MSESTVFPQPRLHETTCEAKCNKCGAVVFSETFVEKDGVAVERVVKGAFRQALDQDGAPSGPVIPFCNCEG